MQDPLPKLPKPVFHMPLPPPSIRERYETMRGDLIAHGGVSLEKIMFNKEYADIREHFGLGTPEENAKLVAGLDPASKAELKHSTLRNVVTLDSHTENNPQFNLDKAALDKLLTPASDIQRQLIAATGAPAKAVDPNSHDAYEKTLLELFNAEKESQNIKNGPQLYVRHAEDEPKTGPLPLPAISQVILKDNTPVMVVDLDALKKDPQKMVAKIHEAFVDAQYAQNEVMQGYIDKYKDIPLKEILTKPQYSEVRDKFNLSNVIGAKKPVTPEYLATLDPQSLALLGKQTLKDAAALATVGDTGNPYAAYKYLEADPMIAFELIQPKDHRAQMDIFRSDSTLLDPSQLTGAEKTFYDHYADMTTNPKKMGFDKPPELYYSDRNSGHGASAWMLKDGTRVIVLDKEVADMPGDQKLDIIAHEAGHLTQMQKNHEHSSYDMMKHGMKLNEFQTVNMELDADKIGMSAKGSCDPQGFSTSLKSFALDSSDPNSYGKVIDDQLNDLAMGKLDHPLLPLRVDTADQQAQQGLPCTPYYPAKTPQSKSR